MLVALLWVKKRGTDLETKLLKIRQMSRSKFFYLDPPKPFSKLMFSNVWPPLQSKNFDRILGPMGPTALNLNSTYARLPCVTKLI